MDTNANALATYGVRDDIREMADRLTKMMPGTTRLTTAEALTVAQIAVAHGLDPFTGEVWGIKGENEKWYGCMIGIAGRRKKSREQAAKEGGVYWTEPPVLVDPLRYNQDASAVVYEVRLRDSVSMQAYGKSLHALTSAGIPHQEAMRMIGDAPVWVGVGIAKPDERSKMGLHARAKKRAENDALKQRYDINLVGIDYSEGDLLPPEVATQEFIESSAREITQIAPSAPPHSSTRTENDILSELGYSDEP